MITVPVTLKEAKAFIRQHHRHAPNPPASWKWGVGLEVDGVLVGVAMAGRPVAKEIQNRDRFALEVTRVCVQEGNRNANSRLYGAVCRAAAAQGYRRVYTYTLAEEDGASLRASGFVIDGYVPAREHHGGRDRYQENLLGEPTRPEGEKIRWRRDLGAPAVGTVESVRDDGLVVINLTPEPEVRFVPVPVEGRRRA